MMILAYWPMFFVLAFTTMIFVMAIDRRPTKKKTYLNNMDYLVSDNQKIVPEMCIVNALKDDNIQYLGVE